MNASLTPYPSILLIMATAAFLVGTIHQAQAQLPAIPEPPVLVYGTVTDGTTNQPVTISSVTWQVTDGADSATLSTASAPPAKIVTQGGQSYYLLEVPFETRVVLNGAGQTITLVRQGQSLELKSPAPTYTLTPFINGRAATLRAVDGTPASGPAFTFPNDPATNGKMFRVGLTLPPADTYAAWAAANFPNPNAPEAARTADPDADGATNEQEHHAGTDPNNRSSVLSIVASALQADGTLAVTFQTVPGKRYQLLVSDDLDTFNPQGAPFTAAAATTAMTVPNAARKFLKLEVVME